MVASRPVALAALLFLLVKQQANADACPDGDDETDLCDESDASYAAWTAAQAASSHGSGSGSDHGSGSDVELEDQTNGALSRQAPSQALVFSLLLAPICGKHSVWLALLASIAGLAKPAAADDGPTQMTCGHLKQTFLEEECCGVPDLAIGFQSVPNPPRGNRMRLDAYNPCDGQKSLTQPGLNNAACFADGVREAGAQAGADVTAGFQGDISTDVVPINVPYYQTALCPVNVHWHLGAEHRSAGQYDEEGTSPGHAGYAASDSPPHARRLQYAHTRYGYACRHYDASEPTHNEPYTWRHCVDMHVGETYEVHWPHSSLGACGTPNQYQSPFYDGVFCGATAQLLGQLGAQDIASNVGVQGQVFTIVNDENYYYPDLIRGMIVDAENEMGVDVAVYTGSTTGTSRNNSVCSFYTPITWQVDRTCHKISASSFDKMCADMKQMRDDMSSDLHAHGARELVWQNLTHDNQGNQDTSR